MTKQDMSGVRTAQDLERKYDLGSIGQLKQNYELQKNNLTKVENELTDFVKATTKNLEDIQNQVDGNITTWFSSGIPTTENYPASDWSTDDDKNNHLGDLYYNQDTGYAYRFALENNIYSWIKITDSDVTEALALANAAKDTADKKRQVFVSQPSPPYDVGDLWIKDEEIYRCQTTRPTGETFEDNDWIKATKYTDDTVANQVGNKLTILSGTVTEIRQDVDELNTTMTNTTKLVDEQGKTVGTLQEKQSETSQTVDSISTKVSSVENGLLETNSNLSNLSDTVDTLNKDVQGVSADFEDFKDNEYVQSIDNLQKQIDGAIQFWNGAEIPTISNYPANEWTTENDKINHQADIYTVVQDVEGEMKQGKSYRFDKINGVWQWIELTDNELSAVQALAQEALDKAKANATEIGTVKSSVSELQQTDESIKASVNTISNQIIPTSQVSGSHIHVEDSADAPLVNLEIEGKSEQETRSGKNLFNIGQETSTNTRGMTTTYNGSEFIINGTTTDECNVFVKNDTSPTVGYRDLGFFKAGTYYYRSYLVSGSITVSSGAYAFYLRDKNATQLFAYSSLNNGKSITLTEDTNLYLQAYANSAGVIFDNVVLQVQLELGTQPTEYEAFGASPSPAYPSEIESVGYENLFKATLTADDGKTITVTNADVSLNDNVYKLTCKNGTDMYFGQVANEGTVYTGIRGNLIDVSNYDSISYILSNSSFTNNYITSYDENKTSLGYIKVSNKGTYTIPDNVKYISFRFGISPATIGEIYETTVQIETGKIAHSYIPYSKYGIEVKTHGKNLYNYEDTVRVTNGATVDKEGWITFTCDNSDGTSTKYLDYYTNNLNLKNNSNYAIIMEVKSVAGNGRIYPYSINDGTQISGANPNVLFSSLSSNVIKKYIVTTLSNFTDSSYGLRTLCSFDAGQSGSITFRLSVIEDTSVTTENFAYKPYQENTTLIVLNDPLRSLPNGVKDIAYIRNNKLYVDRKVGRTVLTGISDEGWSLQTEGFCMPISSLNIANKSSLMCDKFKNYNTYTEFAKHDYAIGILYNNIYHLYVRNVDISTVEEFKAWLSENPTQVDYELATPVTEEIGELQMPSTFKGVSNITTTDELEPIINLEYVRDTVLSDYVEGQVQNERTIREQKIAELSIEDDKIKASVSEVSSTVNSVGETVNTVETALTSQEALIEIISTNIDVTNGNITEVTTTNGFTFNSEGLNIYTDENSYNTQINNVGTYYRDGEEVVSQTTKDGSILKNLSQQGQSQYSFNETNYDFIDERIEVDGEYAYATFYNGEE